MVGALRLRWCCVGAAIVVLATPSIARACRCSPDGPGRFHVGAEGSLPRDATGIPHSRYQGRHGPDKDDLATATGERVTLLRRDGGREVQVGHTIVRRGPFELIVPDTGLRPGDAYTVRVRVPDADHEWQKRLLAEGRGGVPEVVAAVVVRDEDLPLTGATLELTERRKQKVAVTSGRGDCSVEIRADVRDLRVVLPAELEPYRDYLHYETIVDDRLWMHEPSMCTFLDAGRTWTGVAGTDRLFAACERGGDGLGSGVHHVVVRLSAPDGDATFVTPPVKFELDCATDPPPPQAAAVVQPTPGGACGCNEVASPPWWFAALLLRRRRRLREGPTI